MPASALQDMYIIQLLDVLEGRTKHTHVVNSYTMASRAVVLNGLLLLNPLKYIECQAEDGSGYILQGKLAPLAYDLVVRGGKKTAYPSSIVGASRRLGLHRSEGDSTHQQIILTPPDQMRDVLSGYSHRTPAVVNYFADCKHAVGLPEAQAKHFQQEQIAQRADDLFPDLYARAVQDPEGVRRLLQLLELFQDPLCIHAGRQVLAGGYPADVARTLQSRLQIIQSRRT